MECFERLSPAHAEPSKALTVQSIVSSEGLRSFERLERFELVDA